MLCKHRCTASALSISTISNKNKNSTNGPVVWSNFMCSSTREIFFFFLQQTSALWFCCTVDHSSCVELLLSSLLICRTSCSSVFNVSAFLCVHCYVRRGWKTRPAAPLSGRQHNANSLWETTSEQRKWECLAGWCRFMFGHRNNSSHTTWHSDSCIWAWKTPPTEWECWVITGLCWSLMMVQLAAATSDLNTDLHRIYV